VPSNNPAQRFTDIIESITRIFRFTSGLKVGSFSEDEQVVHAVKYGLVIINEAASKLGDAATDLAPQIAWREIRSLGNRLRHEYDGIDTVRIWLMVERELPELLAASERALDSLSQTKQS